jgi:hypothetical protein
MNNKIERMNDAKRREWIETNPTLYEWWRQSGKTIGVFIQANRMEIDDRVKALKKET